MAIFNTTSPSFQTVPNNTNAVVDTTARQIYNTTSFTPTGGAAISFPVGVALRDLTILNTGSITCFVGTSTVTATTGVPLRGGEQLTIQSSLHTQGESGATSWNLYAITASGTTTIEASLGTLVVVE
jgi:hypothetical protein